jgi:hypothetical protein
MTSTDRDYVRAIRTPEVAAWLVYSAADQLWHAEVFARTRGGVQYLETEYSEQPPVELLIRQAFHFGFFSPRPCSLERHIDPSMTHGVLALLRRWCSIHAVDLQALLRDAYTREPQRAQEDFDAIVEQAEWEGIEYPHADDRYQTRRMLLALRNVGYDEIAEAYIRLIRQSR